MDLSQQELPLTAYFTRGSKEAKSRAVPYKKVKSTEDSQSVARSSKRRRSDVQCSTASPLSSSVGQSKPRRTTLQLPTPATSTRKRMRGGRLDELPGKTQLTSTGASLSSVEQNAILASDKDLAQLEFGPTPSKLPQSLRNGAEDAVLELPSTPLAIPSTDRRKIVKPIDIELSPGPQISNHADTGIATPRTSSRRITKPVHGIDDHSPLARSNCHLPSKPSQIFPRLPDPDVSVSHVALSHVQFSARSTTGLSCSSVALGCSDPFYARENNGVFLPRDDASAPPKQHFIQSEKLDGQSTDGHDIPMIPVPSSQSQYLLHLDATPKRKRCSRRIEYVISSQTQEERELTMSTSLKLAAMVGSSAGVSPGQHTLRGNGHIPRLCCKERKSQQVYIHGSTPVGSPVNSPSGPPRSFLATERAPDEVSSKSPSPSRRKRLTSYHSSSCKAKTPQGSARHSSIENITPAHIEDSLTEPESDSDILQVKDKSSTLDLPSREMNQVSRHSPVPRDACPGFAQDNLSSMEDDSATEAESDTEILHCVANIGKAQPRKYRSEVSRQDTPPPPVISPLVSPARSHIAAVPSIIGFTQFSMPEGARLSVPGSCAPYPSIMEQPQIRSESLPSVVRDFIRMFPGDESYPADFPESLRI